MNIVDGKMNVTKHEEDMALHILHTAKGCPFNWSHGCPDDDEIRCVKCIVANSGKLEKADADEEPEPESEHRIHAFTAGKFDKETGTASFAAFLTDETGYELMHTEGSFDTAKEITDYDAELVAFQSIHALLLLYDKQSGYYVTVHPASDMLRHNFFYLYNEENDIVKAEDNEGRKYVDYFQDGNLYFAPEYDNALEAQMVSKCTARATAALDSAIFHAKHKHNISEEDEK